MPVIRACLSRLEGWGFDAAALQHLGQVIVTPQGAAVLQDPANLLQQVVQDAPPQFPQDLCHQHRLPGPSALQQACNDLQQPFSVKLATDQQTFKRKGEAHLEKGTAGLESWGHGTSAINFTMLNNAEI